MTSSDPIANPNKLCPILTSLPYSALPGGGEGSGSGLGTLVSTVATRGLPPLTISGCHSAPLYLLAPYASASITGCSDCDIVIGAGII